MTTLIGMLLVGLLGLIFGTKVLNSRHELNVIEAQKQSQLALDGQRYEKIREILTESIIDGQPAALEALKPLIEVVASQMQGKETVELKQLEHKQQLSLIEAKNEPFSCWMGELSQLRKALAKGEKWQGGLSLKEFETCVQTMAASTERVFGLSLRTLPAAEEQKALPKPSNG